METKPLPLNKQNEHLKNWKKHTLFTYVTAMTKTLTKIYTLNQSKEHGYNENKDIASLPSKQTNLIK